MCGKVVDSCSFAFYSDKVVSKKHFLLKYCLDRNNTQEMLIKQLIWIKLKFFVMNKMLKNLIVHSIMIIKTLMI